MSKHHPSCYAGTAAAMLSCAVVMVVLSPIAADAQTANRPRGLPVIQPAEVAPIPPPSGPAAGERREPELIERGTSGDEPLTLEALEDMALRQNPALARAMAQIQQARGRWVQAGLRPNPTMGYQGNEMGNEGTAGQHGVFYQQTYIRGGKLQLSQAAASQEIGRAEQIYEAQQLRVLTDVRVAFYRALAAQQALDVSRRLVDIADKLVETMETLVQTQEASRVQLLQAQVEAQNVKMRLDLAANRHQAARRQLAAVMGRPDVAQRRLQGDLTDLDQPHQCDDALQMLIEQSPELAAARIAVQQAQWEVERALVQPIPNVQVQLGAMYDEGSDDVFGNVQVGVQLPIYNRNQGNIRAAQARVLEAKANIGRIQRRLQSDLAQVFENYQNAIRQTTRYQDQILPQAEESLDLVLQGYRLGQLDFLTLLTAQRTYFQASLDYIQALAQLRTTAQQINGLLLENSLAD